MLINSSTFTAVFIKLYEKMPNFSSILQTYDNVKENEIWPQHLFIGAIDCFIGILSNNKLMMPNRLNGDVAHAGIKNLG